MTIPLALASGSAIRAAMLKKANVPFDIIIPRIDEDSVKNALAAEQAKPRDVADTLAELKARRISSRKPGTFVIGCDQVLDFQGVTFSKPENRHEAIEQLRQLRGNRHSLFSAAVIVEDNRPIWRHVGQVRLHMRPLSDAYLDSYVNRNWDSIRHSVGSYKLEEEGVRLFSAIDGDYFNVLGMPLIELLNFLAVRGVIES